MFHTLTKLFAVAALATAATTAHAAVISHDAVPVWAQPSATSGVQKLAVKFKPQIKYENSCTAYPAVDATGNTNGGLKPSGSPSAGCKDRSKQQIYARTGWYNNQFAIMYSWYMPKDSPSTGLGHRHEWENLVVWLSNSNEQTASIVGLSASAHGGYKKTANVGSSVANGVTPKVRYYFTWPNTHELDFTSDGGETQPLIQWDQLTDAARNALESTDFGSANVPFKSNFQTNLGKAWYK
jgi:hypothetical protein